MTDAARTDRAAVAAPTRVTRPLGEQISRSALLVRDRGGLESAALLLPIILVGLTHADGPALWLVAVLYLVANIALAVRAPSRSSPMAWRWTAARLLVSVAMVAAGQLLTGSTGLLAAVYLPIIALAAFAGPRFVLLAVAASAGSHFVVEAIEGVDLVGAAHHMVGFAGAAVLVAYGTRREVVRMQRARDRLRRAVMTDRRRARQIAGVE
ncbi:MAG: hypothetical protein M3Y29_01735, partial [Chloroflexota bacterium]|nr:hypothetical protein [Chloroflexota bacterium]